MNVDECRNRAEQCLATAQSASDQDMKRSWQQLAEMWLLWSDNLDRFRVTNEAAAASKKGKSVVAVQPINKSKISGKRKVAEIADRLCSRLALPVNE